MIQDVNGSVEREQEEQGERETEGKKESGIASDIQVLNNVK